MIFDSDVWCNARKNPRPFSANSDMIEGDRSKIIHYLEQYLYAFDTDLRTTLNDFIKIFKNSSYKMMGSNVIILPEIQGQWNRSRVTFTFQLPQIVVFNTENFWPRLLLKKTTKPLFYQKNIQLFTFRQSAVSLTTYLRGDKKYSTI